MKTNSNTQGKTFYQKMGSLFFAFAIADGVVHPKEINVLKGLIREKWLPLDDIEDEYGTDAAYQIEIVFDWLLDQDKKSEACFLDFEEFYKGHPSLFTKNVKDLILETAGAIAHSFSGKNKAELILLGKLSLLFSQSK